MCQTHTYLSDQLYMIATHGTIVSTTETEKFTTLTFARRYDSGTDHETINIS